MVKYRKFFYNFWLIVLCLLLCYYVIFHPQGGKYSKSENRNLAEFPKFNIHTVTTGDFENGLENYLLDHFVFRDKIITGINKVKDFMSIASYDEFMAISEGNTEDPLDTEDVKIDIDKTLEDLNKETTVHKEPANLEDFPSTVDCVMEVDGTKTTLLSYNRDSALAVTALLNKYAELLPENGKVIFTMVPQSVRGNRFVNSSKNGSMYANYDELINAFGSDNVFAVDAPQILSKAAANDEYIYFRTDMHWTPYGSYLVYKEMANIAGKTALDFDKGFDHTLEEPFLGTYYRDNPTDYMRNNADSLDLIVPKCSPELRRTTGKDQYKTIDFLNFNAASNDRYTVFLGGPAGPWTYAVSDNDETENALVLMDSFGLGFFPCVVGNYKEVHYYDPRYFDKSVVGYSVSEMIKNNNIQDIYVVIGDLHSFESGFLLTTAESQLY